METKNLTIILIFVLCLTAANVVGEVHNLTWSTDYETIQAAIDEANDFDVIEVDIGTYKENVDFLGKNITLRSTDPNDWLTVGATVIQANDANFATVTFADDEERTAVLNGFRIVGGLRGIECNDASATIKNCIIANNGQLSDTGGGIYNYNGATPLITNCFIVDNNTDYGAGIYNENSSPIIRNCVISKNTATDDGGGIYDANSTAEILNCTVTDNDANNGGGMYCCGGSSEPNVINCIFWDNSAYGQGDEVFKLSGADPNFKYCDIQNSGGSSSWDTDLGNDDGGNIEGDPLFIEYSTPDGNLVAHWKLDETSGSVAYDSVGDNDGDLYGGPQWIGGMIDGALEFDEDQDYVNTPVILDLSKAWTVSLWIKSNKMTPGGIFNLGGSYYSGKIRIESRDDAVYGGFRFRYGPSGEGHVINTPVVNEGGWHHIVWLQDGGVVGSTYAVYVDGELVEEDTVLEAKYANVPFYIGWEGHFGSYDGKIDDVRIYDRALPATEINGLYKYGLMGQYKYRLSCLTPCINAGDPSVDIDKTGSTDIDNQPRIYNGCVDIGAQETSDVHNATKGSYYSTIQSAIDDASDGDEIVVYPGIYYEFIDFDGKAITVRSIDANDWDVVYSTIVTAEGTDESVVNFDQAENINTVLKGFFITCGSNGVECNGASATISNCVIKFNGNQYTFGGGFYNCNNASPLITNCFIMHNDANYGAGIYNENSSPIIRNCVICNNFASENGGAIYDVNSSPEILNCTIVDNGANNGGGLYCVGGLSEPNIINCIFWDNKAITDGNQIYNDSADPNFRYCDIQDSNGSGVNWDSSLGNDDGGNIDDAPLLIENLPSDINLIAYWKLDGLGRTAYDSANNNHGDVNGATWTSGAVGRSLWFDGTDDYVGIGNPPLLNFEGHITISVWIKPENIEAIHSNVIAHGYSPYPERAVYFRINGGLYQVGSYIRHVGESRVSCTIPAEDENNWVHLVGLFDGSYWRLYRNGVLFDSDPASRGAITVDANWAIGARGTGTSRFFEGKIDDVRIYDRALSAEEIDELYEYGLMGQYRYHLNYFSPCINAGDPAGDYASQNDIDNEARVMWERVEIGADEVDRNDSDEDGDSFPYWWEILYGLDPNKFDAYEDADGDGYANILEYEFGSDPSNERSVPEGVVVVEPNETTNFLQRAINSADDNDIIVLMPGTYKNSAIGEYWDWPTENEWANFVIDGDGNDITLRSLNPSDPNIVASTILSSGKDGKYSVISLYLKDCNSVVHGLTFSGCGLAIRCISSGPSGSQPVVSGCRFINNNSCSGYGKKTPTYECQGNNLGASGIGITDSAPVIKQCIFNDNKGHNGGAVTICNRNLSGDKVIFFADCIFTNNFSDVYGNYRGGGGADCHECSVCFERCVFKVNVSGGSGGGVFCSGLSTAQLENCVFVQNEAYYGGALATSLQHDGSVKLRNCTITGNTADEYGGGLYIYNYGDANMVNAIIWGNKALGDGNDVYARGNDEACWEDPITLHFRNCDVNLNDAVLICAPEIVDDINNFYADPRFVLADNPEGYDGVFLTDDDGLMLHPASPCVDKGDNFEAPLDDYGSITDILGYDIIDIPYVGDGPPAKRDIGAYERTVAVLFVQEGASGTDGLSWDDAFGNLQDALGRASEYDLNEVNLEIWAAEGTYYPDEGAGHTPDSRNESFQLVSDTALYGGFYGDETYLQRRDFEKYETILSGDINAPGDTNDNSYHVVEGVDGAILDGFTVTAGFGHNIGGGMYNYYTSPIVRNCVFTNNDGSTYGGAMYNRDSFARVINCTFIENSATRGAGICNLNGSPTIVNCCFKNNTAYYIGGGIYHDSSLGSVVENCTFVANSGFTGGGISILDGDMYIKNCIFADNPANNGAGVFNAFGNPSLVNCAFINNNSSGLGGGLFNFEGHTSLTNCIFSGNSVINDGGAILVWSNGSASLTNCTLSDNSALDDGGAIWVNSDGSLTMRNCISWGNTADGEGSEMYIDGSAYVSHCDIEGGINGNKCGGNSSTDGGGNINVNPWFVDPNDPAGPDGKWFTDDDGMKLAVFSPVGGGTTEFPGSCIDSGDITYAPATDICGRSRKDVSYIPNLDDDPCEYVDMGAYEMSAVWYVNASTSFPGIGSSWGYAMDNLQEAIAKAKDGEEIWVAEGTYKPGFERVDRFCLDKAISLYGGFSANEYHRSDRDYKENRTILSGDIKETFKREDNCHRVVEITNDEVVLDGFIICYGDNDDDILLGGAGMAILEVSPTIVSCIIRDNYGGSYGYDAGLGHGVYLYHGSPTFENCAFLNNYYSFGNGGGGKGGGMYMEKASPIIANCLFTRNSAISGGAIYSVDSSPVIINSVFRENTAFNGYSDGEGSIYYKWAWPCLYESFVTNCLFAGNRGYECGGITTYRASEEIEPKPKLVLSNCTFTSNYAYYGQYTTQTPKASLDLDDEVHTVLTNCIFWNNQMYSDGPELTYIQNSDIEGCNGSGGTWDSDLGTDMGGNIDENPSFVGLPEFYDITLGEYLYSPDGDNEPEAGVLIATDASRYSVGDVFQYDGNGVARVVVRVDCKTNEVMFSPSLYEDEEVYTEEGKDIRIWAGDLNPKDPCEGTTYDDGSYNFIKVNDVDKYDIGDWIEYNNDGILRKVIGITQPSVLTRYNIYFTPTLMESYRGPVEIVNWGKYAIVGYVDEGVDSYFEIAGKTGHLEVAEVPANSSPCIDMGLDEGLPADLADLDNDGLTTGEKLPYDIMGVPRIQEIPGCSDSSGNSVDIGAFESGGLFSADQTISVVIEDDPCTFDLNIQNHKGGSVTYIIADEPNNGTLTTTSGIEITYAPNPEYWASQDADEFYYRPYDGINYGELTKVTIAAINQVNDNPVAVNDVVWFNEGCSEVNIPVLENDYDPDPDSEALSIVETSSPQSPSNGLYGTTIVIQEPNLIKYELMRYESFFLTGEDSFTYKCENSEQSKTATVTLKANYRPVAVNDSATTELGVMAVINVVSNDTDNNNDQQLYAAEIVDEPNKGQAVIYEDDPRYVLYVPDVDGGDAYQTSFTYKVIDEFGLVCDDANNATVQVTVNATETIKDTDKDGIADSDESILGTNPYKSDTDEDGVYDQVEIVQGFDPVDPYVSGYFDDPLPYATCFFPSQEYAVGESLDGQQGWQVADGNCVLKYTLLDDPVGCVCATMDTSTVVSKGIEDNGTNDGDSNTVVVKLYPVEGAEVMIISNGTTIAGIKFVDTGQKWIQYYNQGWQTSSVSWNYDWAGGNPDDPTYSLDYEEHNYGLVVKFVTDFSKTSGQCQVFWDSNPDGPINWTSVGTASFNSSIKSISNVELRNGINHVFRVRGLYIAEVLNPSCEITHPDSQSYIKSRIPIKGRCYGTNMSGYVLGLYSDKIGSFIDFEYRKGISGRPSESSDPNSELLGYWNSGMWPNDSYVIDLLPKHDLCASSLYGYAAYYSNGDEEGVNYDYIKNIAACGSVKNSVFHNVEEPDISIPWHGEIPFELRRIYNSGRRHVSTPFFPGWTNNLQVTLVEYADYYESSTCSKKVGGSVADKDGAGLAFGAIYVQCEDGSVRLFRHMTGSIDSNEAIYTPYPDDGSGSYIKRTIYIDDDHVKTHHYNCSGCPDPPCEGWVTGSNVDEVKYELYRADGTKIVFRTVDGPETTALPDNAQYWDSGEEKGRSYDPGVGAVYSEITSGHCKRLGESPNYYYHWYYHDPTNYLDKWRIETSIQSKSDRFGNTLYYGWDETLESYNGIGAVNWASTSPDGPNAVDGITISLPYEGLDVFSSAGYLYYSMAKLIIDETEKQTIHYLRDWGHCGRRLYIEVCVEDEHNNKSRYKSYAYRDSEYGYGLLRGIFNGPLLDDSTTVIAGEDVPCKQWDWPKRTTIIGYDSWDRFVERIDYVDTATENYIKDVELFHEYLQIGEDHLYTRYNAGSSGRPGPGNGETYLPIVEGDNYLYRYYWWFFFEPDSDNDEDGQCIFNVTDYYRPEDYVPYRMDCTVVNEKGQLRTQGNICLLNNLLIPRITEFDYDVNLPYTPNEVLDTWLDYNCVTNDYELVGKRIVNEYEQERSLAFDVNNPVIKMFDLRSQSIYDANEDVNTTSAGRADDYLVGYKGISYHDYNAFNFQTETLSYQQLDKEGEPLDHEKPVRTQYVYGLHDGTISADDVCNVYMIQEIVLLNENDPGTADDDEKTTYYEYHHSTDPGPDEISDTDDDAYALTKIINCCGGGVTLYTYDDNHYKQWVEVGPTEEDVVPTERYCYDRIGQLQLKADTYGLVTRYDYDGFGAVTKIRTYHDANSLSQEVRTSFTPADYNEPLPADITLRSVTIYEYDEQGRRVSERAFSAEEKEAQAAPSDERVKTATTRIEYYINNNAKKVASGGITHFDDLGGGVYEPNVTDHSVLEYGYDGRGLKIWEKRIDRSTDLWWHTDYYYNSLDKVVGTVWSDYEDRDILKTTSRSYHGSGQEAYNLVFGADAEGYWQAQQVVDFKYDVLDRIIRRTNSIEVDEYYLPTESATTRYNYDGVGNQTSIQDPEQNCIFTDYDNANRKVREYFAEPFDTDLDTTKSYALIKKELGYHDTGLVRDINSYDYKTQDGGYPVPPGPGKLLKRTEFVYDARSRVTDVNQAFVISNGVVTLWAHTQYEYSDANDGMFIGDKKYAYVVVTDASNNHKQTTVIYNEQATPIKTIFPSSQYQQVVLNGDGSVQKRLVFDSGDNPQWVLYDYDQFSRLEEVTYPDSGTLSYYYDGLGNNIKIFDDRNSSDNISGSGDWAGTITFEYDTLGRTIAVTDQDGYRTDYSYATDGQKQRIIISEPEDISTVIYDIKYRYDKSGRLVAVIEPQMAYGCQNIAGFDYDNNGNRENLTYYLEGEVNGDSVSVSYSYNYDNLLNGFNTSASGVTPPTFSLADVNVDGLGRLVDADETLTKTNSSTVEHAMIFSYDGLSQLTDATIGNISGGDWSGDYIYYKNGDMRSWQICSEPTVSLSYNGNQMAAATGGENFTLDYDENGNLTLIDDDTDTGLGYNWDNKLRSADVDMTPTVALKYDPLGNRIWKSSASAGTRKYIVDIVGNLPVILLELDASTLAVEKAYIYANSQILAQYDGDWRTPLDCKYFYLHDRLGSVRQIIDCHGDIVKLYTYNPFGETIEEDGSFDNSFMFTGQWYDDEIGQYYLRARMYDPHLGRFTGRDPVDGCFKEPLTLHKYLYCGNNVINLTDPSGEAALNFITNTIYGTSMYYSMLAMMLEGTDDWWSVLDVTIAANKWRENWFDPENLRTNPTGLELMADPALRAYIKAYDFIADTASKTRKFLYTLVTDFDNACEWSDVLLCLGAEFASLEVSGVGQGCRNVCSLCLGAKIPTYCIGCLGCGAGYGVAIYSCFATSCPDLSD